MMTKEQAAVIEAAKKWCLAMGGLHGEFLLAQHQLLKAVEALIRATS